ncbi:MULTISPECIES: rhombosortase [Pseudoalteromonas]|uniref:Rhombosortase n=1 Tax=Pseudoalteromonas amylolytica TaxID=1859457 RepID=A0A1S1N0J6_9GAMM|nr:MULTISPECIES: rhombosortase [Pseudoalteromonas]OHU88116.1 rhombosortase [Pseudoalteromonas sp. JW3]OHU91556.1 rhombosortase [Pseudoalteromonas amylolytica]
MIDLPIQKQYILPPLLLIVICALLMLIDAHSLLVFDRSQVEQQWWRIFTGQFMHTNWTHLALNVLGVVFIWILHAEHRSVSTYCWHIIFLALWTGIGIWLFCPDIRIYTGLSGLLHGVIVWGALKDIQVGMKTGILLFVGIWTKLIWEQIQGPSPEVGALIDSTVAIDAHLIGAIGGLVLSVTLLREQLKRTPSS